MRKEVSKYMGEFKHRLTEWHSYKSQGKLENMFRQRKMKTNTENL